MRTTPIATGRRVITVTLVAAVASLPALVALSPRIAGAQSTGVAPLVLRLPASTRALGMGDSYPMASQPESFWYNPALLHWSRGAGISAERYASGATVGVLSSAMSLGADYVGIGAMHLDFRAQGASYPSASDDALGRIGQRGPVVGGSTVASVAYARRLRGMRVGIAGKYVEEQLAGARSGVPAADVGIAIAPSQLQAGLSIQNLGPDLELAGTRAQLPTRLVAGFSGAGLPIGTFFEMGASASVSALRNGRVIPAGGLELSYFPLEGYAFSGRIGGRAPEDRDQRPVTGGVGMTIDRVTLDYAFESLVGVGSGHRIGVRVR